MEEPAGTALERLAKELGAFLPRNENSAKITINAGGIGVWLAVTACGMMLAMNLALLVMLVDHGRKIDELSRTTT